MSVYRRYLAVDPSITERYTAILLSENNPDPRPLEAAKLLLSLARKAARGEYTSPEGKSPYQLLGDFLDVVEQHAEEVGMDVDDTVKSHEAHARAEEEQAVSTVPTEPASVNGQLIRFAGPAVAVTSDGTTPLPPYDEDEDPINLRKLNIERIVRNDGLDVYKDQAGRLWTGLATYWIKRGEFDRAKQTFENGIAAVLTIRDFTQIFDAYAEFSESLVSALMESLANPDEDEDEEDTKETEAELDSKMKEFEELMDRRPFLVNDVLLRRNPNDVQEWEKRVALWGNDDEKVRVCCFGICPDNNSWHGRWQRHTAKHCPRSTPGEPQPIFTAYSLTLQSFTKRAGRPVRRNRIWTALAKYLRKPRKLTSSPLTSLRRCGANGLKWRFDMSKFIPDHFFDLCSLCGSGITTKRFASCNAPLLLRRIPKSTTTITYATRFLLYRQF